MNIFLDANILVSVLNNEYPLFTYSSRMLSLADQKQFHLYTSPVCLAIAFYFAEKKTGSQMAKRKIEILSTKLLIADADRNAVLSSLRNKSILDFEDGIEYYAALKAKCTCIVTEDVDDFHFSRVAVMTSRQFLEAHVL